METTKRGGIALHWLMLIGFIVGLGGGLFVNLAVGADGASAIVGNAPKTIEAGQFFLDMIPSNVVTAAAENQILPVMVFALIFGIGLLLTDTPGTRVLKSGFEGLFEVTMRLIMIVIRMAPLARSGQRR